MVVRRRSFQEEIPPSRINITFTPSTGDASKKVEIPLKMVVLGDFSGGREKEGELADRKPISIKSKKEFDDVLKAQNLELSMSVPNRLVDGDEADLNVDLKFGSLADFTPDEIVKNVEPLKKMMEIRELLKSLKASVGKKEFRVALTKLVKDPQQVQAILDELDRVAPVPEVLGGPSEQK